MITLLTADSIQREPQALVPLPVAALHEGRRFEEDFGVGSASKEDLGSEGVLQRGRCVRSLQEEVGPFCSHQKHGRGLKSDIRFYRMKEELQQYTLV